MSARLKPTPGSNGGSGGDRDPRHQRRDDRDAMAALQQYRAESKAAYLQRLAELVPDGKLAEYTAQVLQSDDDRVKIRAIETVAKIKGWFGDEALQVDQSQHLHLHAGIDGVLDDPKVRAEALRRLSGGPHVNGKP